MTGTGWLKRLGPVLLGILIGGWAMSDEQIDISAKGPDGLPGIFWMIKQEDARGVAAWLDAGGDIEAGGYHGASPVLAAAAIDNWPMASYLLERGARANVSDGRGYTLGFLATRSRVAPEGRYGQALAQVRAILAERGLLSQIYQPATVKRMKADGRWPPAEFR